MTRMSRATVALCTALSAAGAHSTEPSLPPTVVEIRIAGDPVTQRQVMLREMALAVGDPADPRLIDASRQSILDLGLFRDVTVVTEPAPGGIALVVDVTEKRYLLALPRIDSSSDGDLSYGAQLRWNNVGGYNHTFDARIEHGDYPDDRLREREDLARVRYTVPYQWGGVGWRAELEHISRDAPAAGGAFDEDIARAELLFTRDHRRTRPRGGWLSSGGVSWRLQDASGTLAPPREGRAVAAVFGAEYSDVRFHVYSETGRRFTGRLELAHDGLWSDYGYRQLDLRFVEHIGLPGGAHHSLNLLGAVGIHQGGPRRVSAFGLGGSGALRGYELDHIEGERYAYAAAEYLRPLFGQDWLRLLLVAEAGATGGSVVPGALSGGPYASVGAGVRVRVTWFMNLELEVGVAYPLRGGDGPQVFAGSN